MKTRPEGLFSIGELSRYQKISKQTLIFYDKIGLFRPAYVDPDNGYRYYSASQLDYLDSILIMKKIGFSLSEIRDYMKNYSIENSLLTLRRQLTVIEQQIQEMNLIRSRLLLRCDQMEHAQSYMDHPIQIQKVREQHLFYHPVEEPCSPREISVATKKCFAEAYQKGLPIYFQCGVIVPLSHIRAHAFEKASTAFLSIEKTDLVKNIQTLPAGTCACIYHFGDYGSIGNSYRRLLAYCEEHHLEILSDSYEFCINDYITSRNEEDYITKIMFYVGSSS